MNEKQDVILPWVELQDLLFYFHTLGDEVAETMLRELKPVNPPFDLHKAWACMRITLKQIIRCQYLDKKAKSSEVKS